MDKLSKPSFAVRCGEHTVKMEMGKESGRWAYYYPAGDLRFANSTEVCLAAMLQEARELLFRAEKCVDPPLNILVHPRSTCDNIRVFLAATGVRETSVAQPVEQPPPQPTESVAPAPAALPAVACPRCGYLPAPPVARVATPAAKPESKYGPEPDWSSPETWPKYVAAQPSAPATAMPSVTPTPPLPAEPMVELIKGDCPTLDLSVPKEHWEIYAYMLQQKVAINLLVDAVKQMRRQQAGGTSG